MDTSYLIMFIAHGAIINAAALILENGGYVYICHGQPKTFTCRVPLKQGSIPRLQWRINFMSSPSVPRMTRQFTADDPEGFILRDSRPGVNFEFNLTSNSNLILTSVMTVVMDDINATALINNATVGCDGDEVYPIILHAQTGPPSSPLNLTQELMNVKWNPVEMADHYTVSVSPPLESESVFFTSNTSIQLPFLYNQDYNVSVMANNCAGSSVLANIDIRIGCCAVDFMAHLHIENSSSSCAVEGLYAYSCQPGLVPHEQRITNCTRYGTWYPNPNELECHQMAGTIANLDTKLDILIPSLTASLLVFAILMFLFGILFGFLLIKCIRKSPQKNESSVHVEQAQGSVPLYEEIKLPSMPMDQDFLKVNANEAYSHIKI